MFNIHSRIKIDCSEFWGLNAEGIGIVLYGTHEWKDLIDIRGILWI